MTVWMKWTSCPNDTTFWNCPKKNHLESTMSVNHYLNYPPPPQNSSGLDDFWWIQSPYVWEYICSSIYINIYIYFHSASSLLSFMRKCKTGNIAWIIIAWSRSHDVGVTSDDPCHFALGKHVAERDEAGWA